MREKCYTVLYLQLLSIAIYCHGWMASGDCLVYISQLTFEQRKELTYIASHLATNDILGQHHQSAIHQFWSMSICILC